MAFLIGGMALVLGLALGVLWARRTGGAETERLRGALQADLDGARTGLVTAQRDLDATRAAFDAWRSSAEQQRQSEAERRRELETAFGALSQKALAANSEQFLAHAGESLEQRRKAIEELLKPFKETLDRLQQGAQELEGKREKAYGSLEAQLRGLLTATEALSQNSRSLATALRGDPRARGRWGEVALRNIAEMAGMTRHCDFDLQVTLTDGSRPDMVVNFPGGERRIPVDAKVPMDAYWLAFDTDDPERRTTELRRHAEALRNHVRTLARRDYAAALDAKVDVTVLFVPGDPILAAAFEVDPSLQTDALECRVLLATPVSFMMLMHTASLFWQQAAVAENAQLVWEEAREFRTRVSTFAEYLAGVGKGLDAAVRSYDKAIGSYEARVLPQGRRLQELESPGRAESALPDIEAIARKPRDLAADGESELLQAR